MKPKAGAKPAKPAKAAAKGAAKKPAPAKKGRPGQSIEIRRQGAGGGEGRGKEAGSR